LKRGNRRARKRTGHWLIKYGMNLGLVELYLRIRRRGYVGIIRNESDALLGLFRPYIKFKAGVPYKVFFVISIL
jgi:hypothetical protein